MSRRIDGDDGRDNKNTFRYDDNDKYDGNSVNDDYCNDDENTMHAHDEDVVNDEIN